MCSKLPTHVETILSLYFLCLCDQGSGHWSVLTGRQSKKSWMPVCRRCCEIRSSAPVGKAELSEVRGQRHWSGHTHLSEGYLQPGMPPQTTYICSPTIVWVCRRHLQSSSTRWQCSFKAQLHMQNQQNVDYLCSITGQHWCPLAWAIWSNWLFIYQEYKQILFAELQHHLKLQLLTSFHNLIRTESGFNNYRLFFFAHLHKRY